MPKHDQIKDDALRTQLAEAHQQMRTGKASDAVRTISDAYLALLAKRPEMMDETVELRPGRSMLAVMRWPMLGANLTLDSVMAKDPKIIFERDRFATSEAIVYYEFTVDSALAQGL